MPFFPQINSNLILTQLPYTSGSSFDTVVKDSLTGMRYTFPRRASGLTGYPSKPLGGFALNFPRISQTEADALQTFFTARRGRYGSFSFLDPGGNLLQHSEDFAEATWDLTNGVTDGINVEDPFGGNLATSLAGTGSNAFMLSTVGPDTGGMSGFRMCASVWVNARDPGTSLFIGFANSGLTIRGTTHRLPNEQWVRISHSETLWDSGEFRIIIGGQSTWGGGRLIYMFGAQVAPMKGEGAYVKSPEHYGYRPNCRFNTDTFALQHVGPNEFSVTLPIEEVHS